MRRFLGVSMQEAGTAGRILAGIAEHQHGRRRDDEPPKDAIEIFPNGMKSMPFLGFETEEEARRAEQAFLSLSGREATVLAYLAFGHSAKEVAHKLNLSCRTVDTFRTRALLKLRARNTADAVRMLASLSALAGPAPADSQAVG
jgi:DNA-binding CsgD family transcriptional regulator